MCLPNLTLQWKQTQIFCYVAFKLHFEIEELVLMVYPYNGIS